MPGAREAAAGPSAAFVALELVPLTPKLGQLLRHRHAGCSWCGPRTARACRWRRGTCCRPSTAARRRTRPRVPDPALLPARRKSEARRTAASASRSRSRRPLPAASAAREGGRAAAPAGAAGTARAGGAAASPHAIRVRLSAGRTRPLEARGPLLACAAHAPQRLPLRAAGRTDRAAPGPAAQRQPAAAPRRRHRGDGGPPLRRSAGPAARGRPAGLQRHACDSGAAARAQGERGPRRDPARARDRRASGRWCSCARASRRRPDLEILLPDGVEARVAGRDGDFWVLEFGDEPAALFERHGEMPLPPYLHRPVEDADRERYQTVYARAPGAVAAPTAGLHFDEPLLEACERAGVGTLVRDPARRRGHLPAGPGRRPGRAPHARRASPRCRRRPARPSPRAARAAGVSSRSARRPCARSRPAAAGGPLAPYAGDTRLFITPGLPLPRRGRAADELPPARVHAAHAGLRVRRPRARARRVRPCGRGALPVLQLRRRDVRRAGPRRPRAPGEPRDVRAARHRRPRPPRPAAPATRRGRDAGVHAGRHLRHGQGDDAGGTRRDSAPRSCSATPSTSCCGPAPR